MKIKYLSLFALLFTMLFQSCNDGQEYYDGVYISGTLGNNPMISLIVDDQFPKTVDLIVASTNVVTEDITVELTVNESVVENYNKMFDMEYYLLPSECYVLTHPTVVIEKGNYATTVPVKLNVITTEGMVAGRKYMVPVSISKISSGKTVIEANRTVYVALDQVVVTPVLNMGSSGRVSANFWQGNPPAGLDTKNLPAVTYEMRTFVFGYNSGFNTFMGQEENLVIRATSYNSGGGVLDATGGGMGNVKSPDPFPTGSWAHVAMTYDNATKMCAIYINGEQVGALEVTRSMPINLCASYEGSGWDYETAPFYIGYSSGGRYLNGMVSEARVWSVARTASEIRNNMCMVDPSTPGLLAYWRFNEGDSSVREFEDLSGHGFTARYSSSTTNWLEGVRCPE